MTRKYCANKELHGGRKFYIKGKVCYWNNRPMCKWCYKFFTAHIKVNPEKRGW